MTTLYRPTRAEWTVLDFGAVEVDRPSFQLIPYPCPGCGREAWMPINGIALVITSDGGMILEPVDGDRALPAKIRCRKCRRTFEPSSASALPLAAATS